MAAIKRYRNNAAKIQHCPISSKFDMWVDNNVPTLKNFYRHFLYRILAAILKMADISKF
jgi:hypothetical protein